MVTFVKQRNDALHIPFGICVCQDGFYVKCVSEAPEISLLLYHRNEKESFAEIHFTVEEKIGNVFSAWIYVEQTSDSADNVSIKKRLQGVELRDALCNIEYHFSDAKRCFPDPYGKSFSGRDTWGKVEQVYNVRRSPLVLPEFDWEDDKCPNISLSDNIFYRMHVRGFTKSPSSKVVQKGTFTGIVEKKAYLKELGINALILMPIQEFEEVILPKNQITGPYGKITPTGKLDYWGYEPAFHFAPKATYASRKHREIVHECKSMIKQMHRIGIEVLLEFYFDGSQSVEYVSDVLRYWVKEFHIDGVLLSGHFYLPAVLQDPYLVQTKILTEYDFNGISTANEKIGIFGGNFMEDMRKTLKGDEGMIGALMYHLRNNPKAARRIRYIADIKTMSLMDLVSYDVKHNDANGEGNLDGPLFNHSWNCGVEGATKKKKILELRFKQQKNAFLLTFLSQGSPMIAMGDELGQSRGGNNNAYCQDNEISWLNWKLNRKDNRLLGFVKALIRFKKAHPTFQSKTEPKLMDTRGIGKPDMSFHGIHVWQPSTEHFCRQLGVLYTGVYFKHKDATPDNDFYLIFNMHWEDYDFALPMPEKRHAWYKVLDTGEHESSDFHVYGEEVPLNNQRTLRVQSRSIVVLIAKPLVYEIPLSSKKMHKNEIS